MTRTTPTILALALFTSLANAQRTAILDAKLSFPTIENLPLLFDITITPTGDPMYYRLIGPGDYLDADFFYATITNTADNSSRTFELSNGQWTQGSGGNGKIEKPHIFPASCPALP